VPLCLILNLDETGIQIIPKHSRTLAPEGSKQVPGSAKKAVAQITKVTVIAANGTLLPHQLIFAGKTPAVFPKEVLPAEGCFYSCTPSHFTLEHTQLEMVKNIVVPYVKQMRMQLQSVEEDLESEPKVIPAVLVWDNHSTHIVSSVEQELKANHIHSFLLPSKCTSKYQPLDVLFNGLEKRYLIDHFAEWHYRALTAALVTDPQAVDVIPTRIGPKRVLIAALVRAVHEKMRNRPDLVVKAWAKSTLLEGPDDPEEANFELESVDSSIINAIEDMMRTTHIREEAGDANQEEPEVLVQEASDYDIAILDLAEYGDTSQEQDEGEETMSEEEGEDDDFIELEEPDERPARQRIRCRTSANDDNASVESSQRVSMHRGPRPGLIEGKYLSSHHPSPQHLMELVLQARSDIKTPIIVSATQQTEDGFSFVLEKPDRATLLDGGAFFTWVPERTH
jgi:hypothetical protein